VIAEGGVELAGRRLHPRVPPGDQRRDVLEITGRGLSNHAPDGTARLGTLAG
jgi:hypothetical protein